MQPWKVKTIINSTVGSTWFLSVLCSQRSKTCWRTSSSSRRLCHETQDILWASEEALNGEVGNAFLSSPAEDAFIPRPCLAHLSPSAPKLKQPISTGWMMSSLLAWMPSMSAVIARRLHEITMCAFLILAGNSNGMVMDNQPKEGKTRPNPSFQSHSLPFSLSPALSLTPRTPLLGAWNTHPSPVVVTGVWN